MSYRTDPQSVEEHIGYIYELLRRLRLPSTLPHDHEFPTPASGCGPWAATVIVAAVDSLHPECADLVCSGTDDQDTINEAIGMLPVVDGRADGGRVLLLEGNYAITGPIQMIRWGLTLQGQNAHRNLLGLTGGGTRLYIPDGTNSAFPVITDATFSSYPSPHGVTPAEVAGIEAPTSQSSYPFDTLFRDGLEVRDLCIDANGWNQTITPSVYNHGMYFDSSIVHIDNVSVLNASGCGIIVFGAHNDEPQNQVTNCYVAFPFVHGIVGLKYGLCVNNQIMEPGQDVFNENVFGLPAGAGIVVDTFDSDAIIQGNHIIFASGDGITINSAKQASILGNVIDGFGAIAGDPGADFDAGGGIRAVSGVRTDLIVGNIIQNGETCGILIDGEYDGGDNDTILISNNILYGNGGPGIRIVDSHYCQVKDNTLLENANENYWGVTTFDAIQIEGDSYENSIHGNHIRRMSVGGTDWLGEYGIWLDSATHDNWIVLNDLRDSGAVGEYLDEGTNNDNCSGGNLPDTSCGGGGDHGGLTGLGDDDHPQYNYPRTIPFHFPGTIATGTQAAWRPTFPGTIVNVRANTTAAPTGTITVDVLKNGTSIYPSATKPTVPAGQEFGVVRVPDTTSFVADDKIQVEIENVGTDGAELVVCIDYRRTA